MKQIKKKKELIGKTIKDVFIPKESYEDFCIGFDDGSFASFSIQNVTRGYEHSRYKIVLDTDTKDVTNSELVQIGIVSNGEHKKALKARQEEQDKRYAEETKKREKKIEEHEKAAYEKLKKKFEKDENKGTKK